MTVQPALHHNRAGTPVARGGGLCSGDARTARPRSRRRRFSAKHRGSESVEFALMIPFFMLATVIVVGSMSFGMQHLRVQEASRVAARTAATTTSATAPRAAVAETLDSTAAQITVRPRRRRAGQTVLVEVVVDRSIGPVNYTVRGRSSALVEPGVG